MTSARKRGQQEAFQTRRRQPDDTEIRVEARRRLMLSPNSQCVVCARVSAASAAKAGRMMGAVVGGESHACGDRPPEAACLPRFCC